MVQARGGAEIAGQEAPESGVAQAALRDEAVEIEFRRQLAQRPLTEDRPAPRLGLADELRQHIERRAVFVGNGHACIRGQIAIRGSLPCEAPACPCVFRASPPLD
jgi:hypothetical protein